MVNGNESEHYRTYWRRFLALLKAQLKVTPSQQLTAAFNNPTMSSIDAYMTLDFRLVKPGQSENWDEIWDKAFTQMNEYLSSGLNLAVQFWNADDSNSNNWGNGRPPNPLLNDPLPFPYSSDPKQERRGAVVRLGTVQL